MLIGRTFSFIEVGEMEIAHTRSFRPCHSLAPSGALGARLRLTLVERAPPE